MNGITTMNLKTFVDKYTTKSGDRVVAFGKYGYDG